MSQQTTRIGWRSIAILLASISVLLVSATAMAADHTDAPAAVNDPSADINDVYVFHSNAADATNTRRTVFVMTVSPFADDTARFSPAVTYTFWIRNRETSERFDIDCTVSQGPAQMITCTGPTGATDTVTFNTVDAGDGNADAMRIFAGLRDDPFFFDLSDFSTVIGDPSMVGLLVDDMGTDTFAGANTLAIIVDVQNVIFGDSTLLEVFAFTSRNDL